MALPMVDVWVNDVVNERASCLRLSMYVCMSPYVNFSARMFCSVC